MYERTCVCAHVCVHILCYIQCVPSFEFSHEERRPFRDAKSFTECPLCKRCLESIYVNTLDAMCIQATDLLLSYLMLLSSKINVILCGCELCYYVIVYIGTVYYR